MTFVNHRCTGGFTYFALHFIHATFCIEPRSCNGVNASYQVVVGRSENLLGPYVDKDGKDMLKNNWELVLEGDGQKWIGPGHNSIIIQDDEGTDWMIYHSYLKKDGGVGGRLGMLDRVLWTDDGWPYIRNCIPSNSELIPVFYN